MEEMHKIAENPGRPNGIPGSPDQGCASENEFSGKCER